MKRTLLLLASACLVVMATGCAHPISLAGAVPQAANANANRIERNAGLVITDEQRKLEVTSPGGGGDKVSFQPYRDLEAGIYFAMSEVFRDVRKVTGPSDPKVQADGLSYIVTPTISTTSYSPSMLTWPPTIFTVELSCKVSDPQNKTVAEVKVQGEGRAEFDEFKKDVSLSARRASEDALKKLTKALSEVVASLR
jgi:hypothetical protein